MWSLKKLQFSIVTFLCSLIICQKVYFAANVGIAYVPLAIRL